MYYLGGNTRKELQHPGKLLARGRLHPVSLRVSLAGRVSISNGRVKIDEERLPGRQGRLVFAYLASEHGRAVTRDELAEVLWGETPPASWEKALGVIASKL